MGEVESKSQDGCQHVESDSTWEVVVLEDGIVLERRAEIVGGDTRD